MVKDQVALNFMRSKRQHYILQLPTGYGKTKMALDKLSTLVTNDSKILIVVPRNVLKDNWRDEITKWGYSNLLSNITFTTYLSLHKYVGEYDVVILDEGHHISERVRSYLPKFKIHHILVLSATLKKEHLDFFKKCYSPEIIRATMQSAIDEGALPTPKLIFLKLTLDNSTKSLVLELNKDSKKPIIIDYSERKKYKYYKGHMKVECTQAEYYQYLSEQVEWAKSRAESNSFFMKIWMQKANIRLRWLAKQKEEQIKNIIAQLTRRRSIVFCPNIKTSEALGIPCVNSKIGTKNLEAFNNKKIGKIAVVDMIDEGCNLVDCKVGVFQMINSSDRIKIQRIGRIMRHKKPVLIFPYFENSREQEIIDKLVRSYPSELCKHINDLKDLKKCLN